MVLFQTLECLTLWQFADVEDVYYLVIEMSNYYCHKLGQHEYSGRVRGWVAGSSSL